MNNVEKYFVSSDIELLKEINPENTEVTYRENGKELRNSDEENLFSEDDFIDKIKKEVSSFINQSYDNIVVLAGAGASVVLDKNNNINLKYGKTVAMIANEIYIRLKDDGDYNLYNLSTSSRYPVEVTVEGELNKNFNLEDFLSNLIAYESFLGDDDEAHGIKQAKEKIFEIIKECTNYDFDNNFLKHDTLLNVLSKKIKTPNKLTVVTTNYDTLFEEAAEKIDFTVMDGFTFSANPYFDSNMFDWNLVRDIPNVKTNELEYKPNLVNLLKIHGSLTWEYPDDRNKIRRRHKRSVKTPIMIFPSSNKYAQSYEEPYFDLFTKFQDILKKPNTLLVTTGFSFSDKHITKMISSAVKQNTGLALLVSDYNIMQNNENWAAIDKLRENHFRVAFLKATLNDNLTTYLGGKNDNR